MCQVVAIDDRHNPFYFADMHVPDELFTDAWHDAAALIDRQLPVHMRIQLASNDPFRPLMSLGLNQWNLTTK